MENEFSGKIVVVAGGSGGIGRAIAAAFAAEGAQTVLTAHANQAAASDLGVGDVALRPDVYVADLRQEEGCKSVFDFVSQRYGRCDILVNAAGATRAGAFLSQSSEDWQDGFALKFFGCVALCRLFWPLLKAANGHVVNIIGGAARTPDFGFLVGGSVNAAMHNFTKGLSGLGKIDGVNVNAILPGLIETPRVEQLFSQRAAASGLSVEEVRAAQIAKDGIVRIGQPEDVAGLALFLCSERARHIQGTAIAVDGGGTSGVY
ncbi:SDR family oxidoreductase [Glaciimonas sp. CA11.2]|uniref:SDR family oxidoreductase n=1 Tax=Glaciimonas sp. CA11.2 TaxID=3048601 RepID=UPI002AB4B453|nr:SDR family oxidoreductase [Glaciimonas sp. CA11.2]MDY7547164.1 SDR family oxidoreductase [Glaciimonas sp. CA11.2]MEB0162285.1 SDR family oxidoreductase [Glaciimonas sp. CA11.2]